MRKLDQLTGWRFIAAFGVILCHFSDLLIGNHSPVVRRMFEGMANFVGFFFILSGFILAYNYQARFLSGSTTVREFLGARFARIYPACIFSLAVALPCFLFVNIRSHIPFAQIGGHALATLLMIKTWLPFVDWSKIADWNGPMWSIETEFFFYLCFPFLIRPLAKLNLKQNYVAWIVLVIVMIGCSAVYDSFLSRNGIELYKGAFDFFHGSPYFCILEFAIGIITFNISTQLTSEQLDGIKRCMRWVILILVVAYGVTNANMAQMGVLHGVPAILFSIVILGSFTEPPVLKILATPTFVFLGEVSYSLYLLHIPVRRLFEYASKVINPMAALQEKAPPIFALVIVSSSLLLASFCYYNVEAPWRRRLRRFFAGAGKKE